MTGKSPLRFFKWPWRPKSRIAQELDEELAFHLEMRTEKLISLGLGEQEAIRQAHREFGDLAAARRSLLSTGSRTEQRKRLRIALDEVLQDLRFAVRSLHTGRSTLLITGLVLALSTAAATVIFSIFSGVILRSLPYQDSSRLVEITAGSLRTQDTADWIGIQGDVAEVVEGSEGIFMATARTRVTHPEISAAGRPLRVPVAYVDSSFFPLVGSKPVIGRTLAASDRDQPASVAVISHEFWTAHLDQRPDVIGQLLGIGEDRVEVVGVMPRGFSFPMESQVWRPDPGPTFQPAEIPPDYFWMVGRIAPEVTVAQAGPMLQERLLAAGATNDEMADTGVAINPLLTVVVGEVEQPLRILLFAVLLVLLVACANTGAVLLARGVARQQELAIRLSLGASRGRIIRQLLTEAVTLTTVSGVVGLAVAAWTLPALVRTQLRDLPRLSEIGVDGRVLLTAIIATVVTGLVSGAIPAFLLSGRTPYLATKAGGPGAGTPKSRRRVLEAALLIQICLSFVVMTGGGALLWNLYRLTRLPLGYDGEGVTVAQFGFTQERYTSRDSRQAFVDELQARAAALPWVAAAAISDAAPFLGGSSGTATVPTSGGEIEVGIWSTKATPDYIDILGLELRTGTLYRQDGDQTDVVINEAFAREAFGTRDPLGQQVNFGRGLPRRIVGVVNDSRHWVLRESPPPQLFEEYLPPAQLRPSYVHLLVRHSPEFRNAPEELADIFYQVDPLFPIERIESLADVGMESVARERLYGWILGGFALLALLIMAIGVYGVASESVLRGSREIGIRLSLGAGIWRVRKMVLGRTGVIVVVGILAGNALTRPLIPYLHAAVPELDPIKPGLFAAAGLIIALGCAVAALGPAYLAGRVDPTRVLRTD